MSPYYADLPYHNLAHAMTDTVLALIDLIDRSREYGLSITPRQERNEITAAGGHDAHVHLPLAAPFSSKEERTCNLMRLILPPYGYNPEDIEGTIVPLIASTQPGSIAADLAQKRMRRADIKNVAFPLPRFLSNSVKLYYESRQLHAAASTEPLPWGQFIDKQREFLALLLEDDLTMPFEAGLSRESSFMYRAQKNVARLGTSEVRDPDAFNTRYGAQLVRLIPEYDPQYLLEVRAA